jgi:uncharacterized RDD family membrane protein YckC
MEYFPWMGAADAPSDFYLAPDARYSARFARPDRRVAAAAIDWTACLFIYLLVSIPLGALQGFGSVLADEGGAQAALGGAIVVAAGAATLAPVVAYMAVLAASSQTPGMRVLDIHLVVAGSGRAPRVRWRGLLRALLATACAAATYAAVFAVISEPPIRGYSDTDLLLIRLAEAIAVATAAAKAWLLVDRRRQSLQDRLFDTVVVDEVVPSVPTRQGPWGPLDQIDLTVDRDRSGVA